MVDYIKTINSFWDSVTINPLSTGQVSLYFALMHINNRSYWTEWFTASNQVLSILTGMSRSGILKARNELRQRGYIDFRERGTKTTLYKINTVSDSKQDGVQNSNQNSNQNSKHEGVQNSGTLIKHKTENETYKTPIPPLERFEFFRTCYPLEKNRAATEKAYADVILDGIYGEDELVEAAKNYAEYCRILEVQEKYVKTPARWLSEAAFEDYLPGRYKKPEAKQGKTAGFEQRSYDFDALERALVGGMRT